MSLQIFIIDGEVDPKLQDKYTGKRTLSPLTVPSLPPRADNWTGSLRS